MSETHAKEMKSESDSSKSGTNMAGCDAEWSKVQGIKRSWSGVKVNVWMRQETVRGRSIESTMCEETERWAYAKRG